MESTTMEGLQAKADRLQRRGNHVPQGFCSCLIDFSFAAGILPQ
jgi:hypothetical protein